MTEGTQSVGGVGWQPSGVAREQGAAGSPEAAGGKEGAEQAVFVAFTVGGATGGDVEGEIDQFEVAGFERGDLMVNAGLGEEDVAEGKGEDLAAVGESALAVEHEADFEVVVAVTSVGGLLVEAADRAGFEREGVATVGGVLAALFGEKQVKPAHGRFCQNNVHRRQASGGRGGLQ